VAEQTAKKLAVIDFTTKTLIKEISLPNEPTGIAVAPTGKLVYVSCSSDWWPDGMVCEVSIDQGKVLRRLPAGHGARSPMISHDGTTLFVCNQHGDDISVVNIASGRIVNTLPALREPYAGAITPDDSVMVVTNCLPVQKATDSLNIASKMLLYDLKAMKLRDTIPMPTGSHSVFGVTVTPDGKYAVATHLIGMFAIPATKIESGWIHTNNIIILDIKNRTVLNSASLDLPSAGAANPWGLMVSPDGKMLCVANSGANFMSVINFDSLIYIAKTSDYAGGLVSTISATTTLSHDLTRIAYVTDRIKVMGKAPRVVAIVGNRAVTAGYFGDSLEIFDLAVPGGGSKTSAAGVVPLGPEVPKTGLRKGECAFYDGSLCREKWQSCHSCHPQTRTDGLNWTLNGEVQAPKNAKSMLYSWWTPPTSWAGRRNSAGESIRSGISNELFIQPDPGVASTLDTFFMSMKPVPSPFLKKGRLSPSAARGRTIFFSNSKVNCRKCHPEPLYTDLTKYNSGITDPYDGNTNWDTPSIIESWRAAPYDHLGSMDKMRDILRDKGHSNAGELPEGDFNDLMEFVLSL
jgi:Tol biopolymer transport system component